MEYFYVNTIFGVFVKVVFIRNSALDENEQVALNLFSLFHPRHYFLVPQEIEPRTLCNALHI